MRLLIATLVVCCLTSSPVFAQAVVPAYGAFPPVPQLAPPPGMTAPATPTAPPIVIDGHVIIGLQVGGYSANWSGPRTEDGSSFSQKDTPLQIPVQAGNLEQFKLALQTLERVHYNEASGQVNKVAQLAQSYASSHTSHKSEHFSTTSVNGTVNHVVSGTVQHEGPPQGSERCEDRTCGCGTRVAQYRYWHYNRYQYWWRCASTRQWRNSYYRY